MNKELSKAIMNKSKLRNRYLKLTFIEKIISYIKELKINVTP